MPLSQLLVALVPLEPCLPPCLPRLSAIPDMAVVRDSIPIEETPAPAIVGPAAAAGSAAVDPVAL